MLVRRSTLSFLHQCHCSAHQAIACWKQAAELYQQALQQQAGSGQAGGSTPGAWRPRSLAQPLTEDEKQEAWFGYAEVCMLHPIVLAHCVWGMCIQHTGRIPSDELAVHKIVSLPAGLPAMG
jgi:hypothetical protein